MFGIFVSYEYALGASLLSLSLLHFLWDQVRYGISWTAKGDFANDLGLEMTLYLVFFVALIFLVSKALASRRAPRPSA